MKCSPRTRSTLCEIEDLARVEKPLKLLHQLQPLVPARLGVDEDEDGLEFGRRDRLDVPVDLLLLLRAEHLLVVGGRELPVGVARRAAAACARQLDARRRW